MARSHKRELMLLIILLLMFTLFFVLALINLRRGLPVFGMDISYVVEDYLIMLLSFLSIIRIFWSIVKH
jgi:hypothetical protein